MAGPVASIGVSGSGRYQLPNFAPLAQGQATLGAGIGQALGGIGKQLERQKQDAVLKKALGGVNSMQSLMQAAQNNPSILQSPSFKNFAGVLAAAQPKMAKPTSMERHYQIYRQQGGKGSFMQFMKDLKSAGASRTNIDLRKMNESQGKAAGFAGRMANAIPLLKDVDKEGTSLKGKALDMLPFGLGNLFQTEDRQKYNQARIDFATAVLRKETGAVINKSEIEWVDQTYFPAPGDSKEVLAQKRAARDRALEAMTLQAGEGYQQHLKTGRELVKPKADAPLAQPMGRAPVISPEAASGMVDNAPQSALPNLGKIPVAELQKMLPMNPEHREAIEAEVDRRLALARSLKTKAKKEVASDPDFLDRVGRTIKSLFD